MAKFLKLKPTARRAQSNVLDYQNNAQTRYMRRSVYEQILFGLTFAIRGNTNLSWRRRRRRRGHEYYSIIRGFR